VNAQLYQIETILEQHFTNVYTRNVQ